MKEVYLVAIESAAAVAAEALGAAFETEEMAFTLSADGQGFKIGRAHV